MDHHRTKDYDIFTDEPEYEALSPLSLAVVKRLEWKRWAWAFAVMCAFSTGELEAPQGETSSAFGTTSGPLSQSALHGRSVWFNNTYGGERFFAFLGAHPDPARRIRIAFDTVLLTPRQDRFQQWGTINDPDCRANPSGGLDLCDDPNASGVVGIRKVQGPGGSSLIGVACASCHAGFDPLNPPADPNEPTWANIHPTIGNQHLKSGKIFSFNLPATDPRRLMFAGWPDGTVDITALFNDNIMNPGVMTAFWEHRHRPTFDVAMDTPKMRNGQGGEDDVGGDLTAARFYTNIGVCFSECIAPRPDRPDPSAPIDLAQCRRDCADFPPQSDLDDLSTFLATIDSPRFPGGPSDGVRFARGREVFAQECASCHTQQGEEGRVLSNDEVNPLVADPVNATNKCRALTNQWEEGKLWAQFSSGVYKARAAAGNKGYRTMPLTGIWATSPFLHNQSVGGWVSPTATPEERAEAYAQSMRELLTTSRIPKTLTTPVPVGPFPAGTPLTFIFSRDPATGQLLCDDAVENRGHYYGADLSSDDKEALIYWLKYQ